MTFSQDTAKRAGSNHIFLNFIAPVIIVAEKIEESVMAITAKYGSRLWKLRVLQIELKMIIKQSPHDTKPQPIRMCISNNSGQSLDHVLYTEQMDDGSGLVKLMTHGKKIGPLHGENITVPYLTKNFLQVKRFRAQLNGTTYVYDIPEMFKQMAERLWAEYAASRPMGNFVIPGKVIEATELMMQGENLVEVQRQPGENDVIY